MNHKKSNHSSMVGLLTLGALGVVYGDIGTSPLYAFREVFFGHADTTVDAFHVLGVLSLFFWSLTLVVSVKYLLFIMRADNQGEGGVFALLALIKEKFSREKTVLWASTALIFGACLLYADGIITPAISVLSAIEGIEVVTPAFASAVVPTTLVILLALFFIQRRGTERIGKLFGPVMVVWFITLIILALPHILRQPEVWRALNPFYAVNFIIENPILQTMTVLGSVVLCVTGGEALYADMGHFGSKPIRIAWFGLVYPALVINYFGQGAYLLSTPIGEETNVFYLMAPSWARIPLVCLATSATIIASQALIAGAYSLTQQAIGLGFFPRMNIRHTSASMRGQIYMPTINWLLFFGSAAMVIGFRSSSALASAYGIAVTGTMAITTFGFYTVAHRLWNWPNWFILPVSLLFVGVDLIFFGSNMLKFLEGGFVPVIIAFAIFLLMQLWAWGKVRLNVIKGPDRLTLMDVLSLKDILWQDRIPRRICFFTHEAVDTMNSPVPITLQTFISRLHVLPAELVFITVRIENRPFVEQENNYEIITIRKGIQSVILHYGYMEDLRVLDLLRQLNIKGNIVVGDHEIVSDHHSRWHDFLVRLFRNILRISLPTYRYFGLRGETKIIKEVIPVKFRKNESVLLEVDY